MSYQRSATTMQLLIVLIYTFVTLSGSLSFEPAFDVPMVNVTVKEGETAILPCSVSYLGDYQVVWTDQWSTLLSFEDRRIIDDRRLSIERPFTKDWNLHIRNSNRKDQGTFNCQVNTTPIKIKTVILKVDVPAKIQEDPSSRHVITKEGETITLRCNVTGIPMPNVTWTRYKLNRNHVKKKAELCVGTYNLGEHMETLMIQNASRDCWGIYTCTAFNGIPPAASRDIGVTIEFSPEVKLPNNEIGQYEEKETILECIVTANPQGMTLWTRHGMKVDNSPKYRIIIYRDGDYTITLSLRIRTLQKDDFGNYTCMAFNIHGTAKKIMTLYDYAEHRSKVESDSTTTTTTMATMKTEWISVQRRRYPLVNRTSPIFHVDRDKLWLHKDRYRTHRVTDIRQIGNPNIGTTSQPSIVWFECLILVVLYMTVRE